MGTTWVCKAPSRRPADTEGMAGHQARIHQPEGFRRCARCMRAHTSAAEDQRTSGWSFRHPQNTSCSAEVLLSYVRPAVDIQKFGLHPQREELLRYGSVHKLTGS